MNLCEECGVKPVRIHYGGEPGISCSNACDQKKFRRLNPVYAAQATRDARARQPGIAARQCREYRARRKARAAERRST